MNTPKPRTTQDDYNRLIAIAFEERVNAQAQAALLEQKLALAGQLLEKSREESKAKDARIAELTKPVSVLTEADAAADLAGEPRPA